MSPGFAVAYALVSLVIIALLLLTVGRAPKQAKEEQTHRSEPKTMLRIPPWMAWVRCDQRQPVSQWTAVACGECKKAIIADVRTEYPVEKFELVMLPNGEQP